MCKNTLLLQAKFLKAPDRLSEHAKIVQFWSFFPKRTCFPVLFSTLLFSIFSPLPFALNYSLTARAGRHRTFASTLFLCKRCLKFPSTLQPMRFDSSEGPNFRAYRLAESVTFAQSSTPLFHPLKLKPCVHNPTKPPTCRKNLSKTWVR